MYLDLDRYGDISKQPQDLFTPHKWINIIIKLQAFEAFSTPMRCGTANSSRSSWPVGFHGHGGTPKWWFITENPIWIDDLGVPPFQETTISSKKRSTMGQSKQFDHWSRLWASGEHQIGGRWCMICMDIPSKNIFPKEAHIQSSWWFPEMELPPVIIYSNGIFREKKPASELGVPPWRAGNPQFSSSQRSHHHDMWTFGILWVHKSTFYSLRVHIWRALGLPQECWGQTKTQTSSLAISWGHIITFTRKMS